MRLWKRASGALKDQNSIWQANLSRRTALRNPDIEKAVIRATSHHDSSFDRRSVDRVCEWLRLSPFNLKPILWSISNRMENTRSWVVALKGLHLMQTLTNCRTPAVKKIGRLPFDLSNFSDAHGRAAKTWPLNAFVRAYYAFLDQKSTVVFQHAAATAAEKGAPPPPPSAEAAELLIVQELVLLKKLQGLVDLLMQIRPQGRAAFAPLVIHVMDGIIIEIYDLYSRICRGIAVVLMNIYSAGKAEAAMALNVVKKASQQGEDLSYYFEFCQEIGVVNAADFPVIDRIPEEGIRELEQIISGFSDGPPAKESKLEDEEEEKSAIVVVDEGGKGINNNNKYRDDLKTIITDNWEKFDEDFGAKNPFAETLLIDYVESSKIQEPPDLITFL
ncbi:hypothetical protein ABFS82_05G052500 [Erythranthe guttata]|uniref:ENTH domain-containing protein n=1 Tax=Erythranthe guttata TaxID=4155 RepID=A0A022QSE6_ERYGU|nr:PREDICTED: putative clathrin assembly protein At1g25240 [Erythranthe guttata]EYU30218.1 hypothetical protein MIMGU_mgv1a008021mg [Erythranthe guttata]|eukprot:XP_012846000.1 PREDICTED: putative clathrin assembly protein At1g25240 [Erythranthe guttata]